MSDKLEMPLEQFAEAVVKENCRLNEHNEKLKGQTKLYFDAFNKAIARIEKLEAALRNTAQFMEHYSYVWNGTNGTHPAILIDEARNALEGKDD